MKTVNGQEIIQLFESWSPKKLACMENDPIGLAIGTLNKPVNKVLVTLDVNEAVVDEAISQGCELIIAHHPPIFRRLANIRTDNPAGQLYEKLIKHDIAVYAAHTNLDVANGGVNDLLANALRLENRSILEETYAEDVLKLVVFIPTANAEELREALAKAGAGRLGSYEACSYTSVGEGRFRARDGANPHVGLIGELHVEREVKVEVVFPASLKNRLLKAMLNVHPYEEPAYDVIRLDQQTNIMGLGRVGYLPQEMTLHEFAEFVKQQLDVPTVRVVGDLQSKVKKIALVGGDGNKYIYTAKRAGADVFLTGDMYFHTAQDAQAIGLQIVDPGHHVEKVMIAGVAKKMADMCKDKNFTVEFVQSTIDTEPFLFV
ncbi:Nif3-like dinuclear metal center hexameric protein [Lysinibacillus parviboronicapiens]|uniref:Nif3-like dinuclear metal center hexameric protein n=1 Tax=Lysinibacillus parviboronicapiens TaxID=436516 RepID=UPI000D392381|nr:Nif3-like dinuclear metal center hexameric protein [Lysinibacillus parviboronicapiens]